MKKQTPQELGAMISQDLIDLMESGIRGMTRDEKKAVMKAVSSQLMLYFLMKRL